MSDQEKTTIDELQRLRRRVAELEEAESERKRAEASLAEERNLLRTLIDNLPDYVFIKDAESRFVINNVAHVHVMGATTQEEVVGKTDFDFFPEELAAGYYADEQGVIRSGQPLLDREEFTIDLEGQKQWLLTSKVPLRDSSGLVVGLVGISRDITERKLAEAERERLVLALEYRSTLLQTAAEVSRAVSSILDPNELRQQVVDLAHERFNLYYAGLFLVDETGEWTGEPGKWAVLRAGTGEAGRRMLEQGHKLEIGGASMIGWCVANKQARIALDVGEEAVRFENPLLPETRSELALPLISRGQAIGALTIQSTQQAAFSDEDIVVLQTMADQLANAIQNARLFTETQEAAQRMQALAETSRVLSSALDEDTVIRTILESIYWVMDCKYLKVATVDEWAGIIEDRHGIWQGEYDVFPEWMPLSRYPLDHPDILADIYRTGRIEIIEEWDERFNREIWDKFGYEHLLRIFMPIKIRDRVIGVAEVGHDKREKDRIVHEEIQTLAAFVDQAAAALENARLLHETQQAARQLAEERNLLRTLIDNLPDYIYVKDKESRFLINNMADLHTMGATTQEEVAGKTDFDVYPEELAAQYYADEQAIIRSGQPLIDREELVIDQTTHEKRWSLTTKVPLRDSTGAVVGLVGIGRDFTELKQSQESLAREHDLLRTLIDNTPDFIYGMDAEGRFVLANMTIARSVGAASPDELLGKTNFDFHPPEEATQLDATDQRVIQSGQPLINYEEVSIDQAGNKVWTLTNEVPLRDSQGKVVVALGISRDITELKRAEARLERRAVQLQAAAEVARDATTARDLDELLNRAVNLVRDRFGFYHAGIFLVDDQGEYAILTAATGEAGRAMLERGHKLRVGEVGIVGYVAGSGQPRIALDVGADAVHFRNPFLPETRSEMALPLKVGGRVIGVLDVQSEEASAFDEDDVRVLQTMADQLAVAIQNVRLLHEMQQTVRELEAAHGRYTREAWRAFVRGGKRPYGYRYRWLGVEPVAEQYPEAREALQQGRPVVITLQPESHAGPLAAEDSGRNAISSLAVPIKLRGQAVGTLNLRFEDETVPPETVLLVEEVADRLALVLENARLMQEAQNLVLREQQINLVSAQVRSSISMETILQNTVRELGKALGASRTFIQLGTEPGSLPPSDGAATVGDQERDETRL